MTDEIVPVDADLNSEKRKRWLTRLAIAVAVIAVLVGLYWVIFLRGYVNTDNAYVGADSAQITPLVSGPIKEIPVSNTQMVARGEILMVIDDADLQIELANARAAYQQAVQKFNQARATTGSLGAQVGAQAANVGQAAAALQAARADLDKARDAAARREALAGTGAVSAEELSSVRAALAEAQAGYQRAEANLTAARASTETASGNLTVNQIVTRGYTVENSPDVLAARARVQAAELNLARTVIRAPIAGVVTQKQVQVGQRVAAGMVAMTIVPINAAFVDANFKESQLKHVRPGQPVELTSEFYGSGVVYHGVVKGFAGGTGAAFALIPAQNATGNWVKVVQRLPVRIVLDPKELAEHPLRVGLSMEASINTRDQ